jgi:hypothetical protein
MMFVFQIYIAFSLAGKGRHLHLPLRCQYFYDLQPVLEVLNLTFYVELLVIFWHYFSEIDENTRP